MLRTFIRSCLREAATSVHEADEEELALAVIKNGLALTLVLYNPSYMDLPLRENNQGRDAVVAFLHLNTSGKLWRVANSAAEHGYGPLIYDAALSLGRYVAPDEDITPAAKAVWKFYATQRAAELETVPNATKHKASWLRSGMRLRQKAPMEALKQRHENFVSRNRRSRHDIERIILAAGSAFFRANYGEV